MSADLAELFKHNLWANLCLIDACAVLADDSLGAAAPGAYGSVRDTLVHLVGAEGRYVARLEGGQPDDTVREGQAFPGFDVLREQARSSGEALIGIAEGFQPGEILRGTWRGEPYELPASILIIQAINHATEHRTNITTILSAQGLESPELDGWTYGDQE